MYHIVAGMIARDAAPLLEIERLEVAALFDDDFGMPHVQQRERALDRADIDRLPEAVEHEHVLIERVSHRLRDYHSAGRIVNPPANRVVGQFEIPFLTRWRLGYCWA